MNNLFDKGILKGAKLSDDRVYRYALWRLWDVNSKTRTNHVMFVGLNPSIADENTDDATIRKCIGFARRWGYGGMYMLNLYAYRATQPSDMVIHHDPVGPENDVAFAYYRSRVTMVIACWGSLDNRYRERVNWKSRIAYVQKIVRQPMSCLGTTKDGSPRHPSRLAYATLHEPFSIS